MNGDLVCGPGVGVPVLSRLRLVVAVVMIATALAVNLIVRLFRPKPAAQR